jgi:hypothetical protein
MFVRCPSGLTGEVRKLKGKEINILTSIRLAKQRLIHDKLLENCWISTTDPGPYGCHGVVAGNDNVPWEKILVCDRYYTLIAIRIATYGSMFSFSVKCDDGNLGGCGKKFIWDFDLENDLDVYDLPKSTIEKIANNDNRFEARLYDKLYTFKILTGRDEVIVNRNIDKRSDALITTALGSRIISIEGVEHKFQIGEFLEELDFNIQQELLSLFDGIDGGVEGQFEIMCPNCGNEYEVALPLDGKEFWIPEFKKNTKKKSRKKRTMKE